MMSCPLAGFGGTKREVRGPILTNSVMGDAIRGYEGMRV